MSKNETLSKKINEVIKEEVDEEEEMRVKKDKELAKFSKKVKKQQLMQSDLFFTQVDQNYRGKLSECFEYRTRKMRDKVNKQNKKWEQILNTDKNYNMNKRGYKKMLNDIEEAKVNLSKFKRGLSIFED